MSEFELVASAVVLVLSVTRATRLIVDDEFPPVLALRARLAERLPAKWAELLDCPWCTAPYLAAPAVGWYATVVAYDSTLNDVGWWLVNGWAAVSWLAAWLTLRDLPPDQR